MPRDDTEDYALMRRLADAEPDALRSLYKKYGALVYGIALRITGEGASAEEVTQDAFLRVWQGAASYSADRGSVATWLGRVTRNCAIDAFRRMKIRDAFYRDDWTEVADPKTPDPEEETSREFRAREVRAAVSELPEAQRIALSLAFFQGMTHSEIAASLSLPLGTVKSRIRDAMLSLRERLGERNLE
jgi:RNA polymerase sigma-70 factor (ECF subfamily)